MNGRMMMTASVALFGATAFAGTGPVSDVSVSQDPKGVVTIGYVLARASLVSLTLKTNGAPVAAAALGHLAGDCGGVTAAGSRQAVWKPYRDLPQGQKLTVTAEVTARDFATPPDYMAVDLATGEKAFYACADEVPGGVGAETWKKTKMLFRRIPAAGVEWTMGSPEYECKRSVSAYAETPHQVLLTRDYYLAVYETSALQWKTVTGSYANSFSKDRDMRPAENMTFAKLGDFIEAFNARVGLGFGLPTEAQWEFACRAGEDAPLYTGEELTSGTSCDNVGAIARFRYNGGFVQPEDKEPDRATCGTENGTAAVGSYSANAFGLYDMLGNVEEFCADQPGNYATGDLQVDPASVSDGTAYVTRGGSWKDDANACRAAQRTKLTGNSYQAGVRLCLTLPEGAAIGIPYVRKSAEPRIVTVSLKADGQDLGDVPVAGDANRLVSGASGTVWWRVPAELEGLVAESVTPVVTEWTESAPPNYFILNLQDWSRRYYVSTNAIRGGILAKRMKTNRLPMRRIPAAGAEWRMGAHLREVGAYASDKGEEVPHAVVLSRDYWMAVYETTGAQDRHFAAYDATKYGDGWHTSWFTNRAYRAMRPVENLSWDSAIRGGTWPAAGDAVADGSRIGRLRSRSGLSGFDLPTRAQWQYAARAGTTSGFYTGEEMVAVTNQDQIATLGSANLGTVVSRLGRFRYNGGYGFDGSGWTREPKADNGGRNWTPDEGGPAEVGTFPPSPWGLYDIVGNVSEYCLDWCFTDVALADGNGAVDPKGPTARQGEYTRTTCGGNWKADARQCRSAAKSVNAKYAASGSYAVGYRLVLPIE